VLWNEFEALKEMYQKKWKLMKKSLPAEMAIFLKKSFLTVDFGLGQIELKNTAVWAVAVNSDNFFVADNNSKKFITLVKELKKLKDNDKDTANLKQRIKEFDVNSLKVRDFQVEIRFPYLNMRFIRGIKKSGYVDPDLSCSCDSCLKVVLKQDFI